ncbi:DUF1302 domain-containing protein [Thalassotalea maritima]|uniref:DUF1302 domain-containing protein n=1 Tax=Thalassotalea maritima TaxID=3242416 RepID=UPI0035288AE9
MKNYNKTLVAAALSSAICAPAFAGEPIEIADGLTLSYKGTLNYSVAVRSGSPDEDNLSSGNANFDKRDLVNNSLSFLFETYLQGDGYGVVLTGSTFYDDVYHDDKFSSETKRYHGGYSRLLDAYAYTNFAVGDEGFMDIRVGSHVVAWGEALFFPSMSLAQGPSDAIKASVPGTEVRDILLPEEQISVQYEVNQDLSILAHYQFDFHETLVSTPGSYMSTSEAVGNGAYCLQPMSAETFGFPAELGVPAEFCGFAPRQADKKPDGGQWGVGVRYRPSLSTEVGVYYLNYDSRIPLPVIEPLGFTGETYPQPLPMLGFPEYVPGSYAVNYFDDIDLYGATFTTITGAASIAGEFTLKQGAPTMVNTFIPAMSADEDATYIPTPVRSDIRQFNLNSIYNFGSMLGTANTTLTSEVSYVQIDNVENGTLDPQGLTMGFIPETNKLFYTDKGIAFSASVNFAYPAITDSWDLSIPVAYSNQLKGRTITGGVGGKGDQRFSIGATFTHPVSEVQVSIKYLDYLGSTGMNPVEQKPLSDRDNLSLSVKWSF